MSKLNKARSNKNDEFYTQLPDVESEMFAYLDYNADVFRDKTVLLPCDDPHWSAFTQFFALKFDELGLRKLISTSYNPGGRGKLMTLTSLDLVAGAYPLDCLQVTELASDGDFRSTEVTALRDESDFVITNPPFSLFREFLAWIREGGQQFSLISNKSAATYKETFPLIMNNELWVGARPWSGGMWFVVPDNATDYDKAENGKRLKNVPASWYTNIDHGRRHEELRYMTMAKNQEFNIRLLNKRAYVRYDNYDAIEVPVSNAIPCDYKGVMGVPISYLDKHCPEVFEIVGMSANGLVPEAMKLAHFKRHNEPFIDGKKTYQRIFIRAIN